MNVSFEMDGRDLFAKLADRVARGELLITHFVMNLMPEDRRYQVNMQAEVFTPVAARTKLTLTATAFENDFGERPKPVIVTMPQQVRELIFDDEEPPPVYDGDLK
jgi:hypothetical protein